MYKLEKMKWRKILDSQVRRQQQLLLLHPNQSNFSLQRIERNYELQRLIVWREWKERENKVKVVVVLKIKQILAKVMKRKYLKIQVEFIKMRVSLREI